MSLKVGVIGAAGKMGSEVCKAVEADDDLELVARVGRGHDLEALRKADTQVAVEFTTHVAAKENALFCLDNDIHVVIGTTGFSDDALAEIARAAEKGNANAFFAPNFAVGAVLMMRFASQAAVHFKTAEIIERHHQRKLDAPSGTALRTAQLMNEARGDQSWETLEGESESLPGSRGGEVGRIRVHSLRDPGSVAHQEVVLSGTGETLTIRHDSLDRVSFMPGVLLAVKKVPTLRGLTVGLESLLGI